MHLLAVISFVFGVPQPAVELFKGTANIPASVNASSLLAWPPAPSASHTVKELGPSTSAADCQAKCVAYRNADASPVSGWTTCKSFTWLPEHSRCVAFVDAAEWSPVPFSGAVAGLLSWPPAECATAADCSYNGECNPRTQLCRCNVAWKGDRCQTLSLLPTVRDAGLRLVDDGANTSTWGGAAVLDPDTGLLHMWSSEMLAHCGIDSWTTNSHVIHAASADGGRTFTRRENTPGRDSSSSNSRVPAEVWPPDTNRSHLEASRDPAEVWPAFSHEPNVVRAPTGEWVMYWTALAPGASPQPICEQCTDGNTPAHAQCAHSAGGSGPTYMSVSSSPDGPWGQPQRLFASQATQTNMDTNLAVTILSNGSAIGISRTGGSPTGIVAHLVTASDWRDPDTYIGRWEDMLFPNTTIMPDAGVEDPSVYVDASGVFHAVFHNQIEADDERLCGGHAYSVDGLDWVFTGTSWSNEVHFMAPGGADFGGPSAYNYTYRFSRMERPHLVFGDAKRPFQITGLTTGVQYGEASPISVPGQDACYTLFQPVMTGN